MYSTSACTVSKLTYGADVVVPPLLPLDAGCDRPGLREYEEVEVILGGVGPGGQGDDRQGRQQQEFGRHLTAATDRSLLHLHVMVP